MSNVAIYCKDCGKMFYACDDDPLVIADDAEVIKEYADQGHSIKKVSTAEVKANFNGCICGE